MRWHCVSKTQTSLLGPLQRSYPQCLPFPPAQPSPVAPGMLWVGVTEVQRLETLAGQGDPGQAVHDLREWAGVSVGQGG